jgi:hypothetical protein
MLQHQTNIKINKNPITEQVVKQHLKSLGYSADALNPNDMKEFIEELQDLWEKDGLQEFPQENFLDDPLDYAEFSNTGLMKNSQISSSSNSNHKITKSEYQPTYFEREYMSEVAEKHNDNTLESKAGVGRKIQSTELCNPENQEIVTIKSETNNINNMSDFHQMENIEKLISSIDLDEFRQKAMEQKIKPTTFAKSQSSRSRSSSPEISFAEDYSSFEDFSSRVSF